MSEVAGRMSFRSAQLSAESNGGFACCWRRAAWRRQMVCSRRRFRHSCGGNAVDCARRDVWTARQAPERAIAIFGSQLKTVYSTAHAIEELVRDATCLELC